MTFFVKMGGLFLGAFGDEAAVGGEGVGAGEEALVFAVVVYHDEVVAVAELELLHHVGGGVAEVHDVFVVEGHHEFFNGEGVVLVGLEDEVAQVVHDDKAEETAIGV